MAPTLLPGDRLLVARVPPHVGDVVLAPDPRAPRRELVKRVVAVDGRGIVLRGDNPAASTDARTFGALARDAVRWRVLGCYWPRWRLGPVGPAPRRHRLEPLDDGGDPACAFPEALIAGDRERVRSSGGAPRPPAASRPPTR